MMFENTIDQVTAMCDKMKNVVGNRNKAVIIDGHGEILLNGVEYQVQIVLEPKKNDWVDPNIITLRAEID